MLFSAKGSDSFVDWRMKAFLEERDPIGNLELCPLLRCLFCLPGAKAARLKFSVDWRMKGLPNENNMFVIEGTEMLSTYWRCKITFSHIRTRKQHDPGFHLR